MASDLADLSLPSRLHGVRVELAARGQIHARLLWRRNGLDVPPKNFRDGG